jgi:GNAT superfamily N-acetyltransferase
MDEIEVLEKPEQELIDYLGKKIADFNWAHWEVNERVPLAVQIKNIQGDVIAGAAARTFGDWLLLDTLWVSDELRGQNVGSKILKEMEAFYLSLGFSTDAGGNKLMRLANA